MIRRAAIVAVALCLSSTAAHAQSPVLTVNTASADVHKSPSIASPVIGRAAPGTALEITREVGDWIKISWASAPDHVGYVRRNAGLIANKPAPAQNASAVSTPAPSTPASSSSNAAPVVARQATAARPADPLRATYIAPPTHFIGFGGRIGGQSSTLGFGAGARAWSRGPLGLQLEVSRFAQTNSVLPGQMTTMQLAPSVLYAFADRVSDYLWMRPYAGVGVNLRRSTWSSTTAGVPGFSEKGLGAGMFGGGEMTFASAPRFAVSVDAGYWWADTNVAGFEPGGLGFSLSGHWYVK